MARPNVSYPRLRLTRVHPIEPVTRATRIVMRLPADEHQEAAFLRKLDRGGWFIEQIGVTGETGFNAVISYHPDPVSTLYFVAQIEAVGGAS